MRIFEKPFAEIIAFETADIITTSGGRVPDYPPDSETDLPGAYFDGEDQNGALKVLVDITIPGELTKEERSLIEKLAEQPNFKQPEKVENQNILERMKSFFRG